MKNKILIIFCLPIMLSAQALVPEVGTFRFFVAGGPSTYQIEGDSVSGFRQFGINAGIGAYFMPINKFSVNMELNYAMRGASGTVYDDYVVSKYKRTLSTNYIEAPIYISYHDKQYASFGLGVVLGGLTNASWTYENNAGDSVRTLDASNYYNPLDISMIATATIYIQKHFGINLRFIHSVVPANKKEAKIEDQYHSTLSARFMYIF
jgi:hypothetical protein